MTTVRATAAAQAATDDAPRTTHWSLGSVELIVRRALDRGSTRIGLAIVAVIVGLAIIGPLLAPDDPNAISGAPFSPPGDGHWLGTDTLGRDVLSRVLHGGGLLLLLALAATVLGVAVGALLGLYIGSSDSSLAKVTARLSDCVLMLPNIVFALLMVSVLGPQLWLLPLLVAVGHTPEVARVLATVTRRVNCSDFVLAARGMGVSRRKIMASEILPNVAGPILVEWGLRFTWSIATLSALAFLGFGVQPPQADWGLMINQNMDGLTFQPWGVIAPVVLIAVLTLGMNMVADGLARAAAETSDHIAVDELELGVA